VPLANLVVASVPAQDVGIATGINTIGAALLIPRIRAAQPVALSSAA
jgi:hypothetical protein